MRSERLATRRIGREVVRFGLAYLVASVIETIVFFEGGAGHIPFTMYPDYFVIAPVLPFVVFSKFTLEVSMIDVVSSAAFIASLIVVWLIKGLLTTRKRAP